VAEALLAFVGEHEQLPPAYSAIKRAGEPAYRAARRGEAIDLEPRRVVAHTLRLVSFRNATGTIEVECGKGYYVRALARDLGRALGVGAHVSALRRTSVGPFDVMNATPLDEATARLAVANDIETLLHAPDAVLATWPAIILDGEEVARIRQGRPVSPSPRRRAERGTHARAYGPEGYLESIAIHVEAGSWRPIRVFAPEIAMKP
jgi:tRNA pseudouridine55 synthase